MVQINMVPEYPAMLKGMGLIDSAQQKVFESYCARITTAIKAKFFSTACAIWDEMINGDLFPYNRCVPPIPCTACASAPSPNAHITPMRTPDVHATPAATACF